jgi:hypothetical protein
MPAIGKANGSQGERLSAWGRIAEPVPVFGPAVVMVIITVVGPDPAAIMADGLKPQLDAVRVGSAGENIEQLRATLPSKFAELVGVAVKV